MEIIIIILITNIEWLRWGASIYKFSCMLPFYLVTVFPLYDFFTSAFGYARIQLPFKLLAIKPGVSLQIFEDLCRFISKKDRFRWWTIIFIIFFIFFLSLSLSLSNNKRTMVWMWKATKQKLRWTSILFRLFPFTTFVLSGVDFSLSLSLSFSFKLHLTHLSYIVENYNNINGNPSLIGKITSN